MNQQSALPTHNETKKELEALIESVPGGIFSYSADETEQFAFVSETMLRLLGYTREEFLKKFENRFSKMVWQEDRARVLEEIAEQIRQGDTDHCEYRIETKSGELRWFYDAGRILRDETGKGWFYVVVVDITDRKKVEMALAQEISRSDAIVNAIPGGVGVFQVLENRTIKALYLSDGLCALGGRDRAEYTAIAKRDLMDNVHPDDRHLFLEQMQRAEGEGKASFIYRSLMKSGRYHWVKLTAHGMSREADGAIFSAVFIDVDEIKQKEFDAVAQHQKLNLALEGSDVYVWEYDPVRGQVIMQTTGGANCVTLEDVIRGKEGEMARTLHPDSEAACQALHEQIRKGAPSAEADLQFVEADGNFSWRRIKYLTLFDDSGRPVRAVGLRDQPRPRKAAGGAVQC